MMLSDVRDHIASLNLTQRGLVFSGKLPDKELCSIGVYNSKHQYPYKTAIGGPACESYGIKYVTLLVHWNRSQRETEKAAQGLFEALLQTREAKVNQETIKFIQPLYDVQDVGSDDAGIYEMVIEAAVVFSKERE